MSNGNGHHWSKFCWRDWQNDRALRACSLAARGFWVECLAAMHDGDPVGHLTMNGEPATPKQMAANANCSEREAVKLLAELEAAKVFSRTADGTIYSRRMVKDAAISEAGRRWGKTGGNPNLMGDPLNPKPNGGLTPPVNGGGYGRGLTDPLNPQNLDSEVESEKKERSPPKPSHAVGGPRRADGSNLRAAGTNPRALGTNPRGNQPAAYKNAMDDPRWRANRLGQPVVIDANVEEIVDLHERRRLRETANG
jgi:hypothetical protein